MSSYDDILRLTGGFGRHQWKLYFLSGFPIMCNIIMKLGNVLLIVLPRHRCRLPYEIPNTAYELDQTTWEKWYPYNNATGHYSSCSYLVNNTEVKCKEYIYGPEFGKTIPVAFGLACDDKYLLAMTNSISLLGLTLGSLISGSLSDRFGRKKTFLIFAVLYLAIGASTLLSRNIYVFIMFKLMLGFSVSGLPYTMLVILIESTITTKRVLSGSAITLFHCIGTILTGVSGLFTSSWMQLDITYTLFGLPCLFYYWLIPESGRWLLSKRKIAAAKRVIINMAKENGVTLSDNKLTAVLTEESSKQQKEENASIFKAFKYPRLRIRIMILMFLSFSSYLVYFGIAWNVGLLSGNIYVNIIILGFVDFPGLILVLTTGQKFRRRLVVCCYGCVSGLALLISCIPISKVWTTVWIFIGKLTIGVLLNMKTPLISEIVPTVLRNSIMGCTYFSAGVGAVVSPYIIYLADIWTPLPYALIGALIIMACALCLVLPETSGKKLPETLEDGDSL